VTTEPPDEYARLAEHTARAQQGNLAKEAEKLARQGKLFVRDRLALLLDEHSFVEDGLLANALAGDLPADGVVTGTGRVDGRPVCVMANDPTVKAGSWGARTVEKIVRLTRAQETELPREVSIGYTDSETDYRRAAVVSRRLVGGAARASHADLAVVTNDAALATHAAMTDAASAEMIKYRSVFNTPLP
jgi:acetyl-CoA carboxylase carboxyltransferase component